MHIPTQTPTATPTPAPPAPTPTPSPTLTPIATPAQGYQVVTRNQEYAYDIDVPEGWTLEHGEYKNTEEEQGRLVIIVEELADGTTLERFAQSVRDGLREDWGPDASRFEITSFERTNVGGRDAYSIAYRVRGPDHCTLDTVETIVVALSIPDYSQGFRASYSLCGWREIVEFREARTRTLDSFRVAARPSDYYTQFVSVHGVTVKASSQVAPEALIDAAEFIARMMLGLRNDIRACLTSEGAAVAVFPKDGYVVELPEFAHIKGKKILHVDIPAEEFQGGLGAVRGQPVSAVPEWNLLEARAGPYTGVAAMHEFAHAVMNLCFPPEDIDEVAKLYDEALQADALPDESYAMLDEREFFAETSLAYLNAPIYDWGLDGSQPIHDALRTTLPQTFALMERVYGDPLPPPAPTPIPLRKVVNLDHKYAYSIEIPQDWTLRASGEFSQYWGDVTQGDLVIRAVDLADGTDLEQFAQSVRGGLLGEWPNASLFEITAFERTQVGGRDAYSIAYRVWENADAPFFEDAAEIVVVASSLPGAPQGFRASYALGNWLIWNYGAARTRVLDSFRILAE